MVYRVQTRGRGTQLLMDSPHSLDLCSLIVGIDVLLINIKCSGKLTQLSCSLIYMPACIL